MTGISAVIITRNEARNIERCIQSLHGLVDEVVVVDAESTDNTQALSRDLGARVIERPWTDYSDQKNFANDQAIGTYILSMDADEVLSPQLANSLRNVAAKGLNGGYRVKRLTNYCGSWIHHCGWYPDAKIRLFPKTGTYWKGAHVHEELELPSGMQVATLDGDLLHYSYHSVADHLERLERYSDLHARKMLAANRKGGLVKQYLSPIVKFIQTYLLQRGFLDGMAGLRIAWYSAYGVHLKYVKLAALRINR